MAQSVNQAFIIAKNAVFSSPFARIGFFFTHCTKWFYAVLALALFAVAQLALSTDSVASRTSDPVILSQAVEDLEKEPAVESKTTEIVSDYQATPTHSDSTTTTENTVNTTNTATTTTVNDANTTTATTAPANVATIQYDHININGHIVPIFYSSDTMIDAGGQAGLFNYKGNYRLIYGHNTPQVFGILSSLPIGTTFTITIGGNTTTYRITNSATYDKATVQSYMKRISKYGQLPDGSVHSFVLMTCAGTSYGNGDASHRTLVGVDAI